MEVVTHLFPLQVHEAVQCLLSPKLLFKSLSVLSDHLRKLVGSLKIGKIKL